MRVCKECSIEKDDSEFYSYNGLHHSSRCRECTSKRTQKMYNERKVYLEQKGVEAFREKYGRVNHPSAKVCKECGIEKNIDDFQYEKVHDWYKNICKECNTNRARTETKVSIISRTVTTTDVRRIVSQVKQPLSNESETRPSSDGNNIICTICKESLCMRTSKYTRSLRGVIVCSKCRDKLDSHKREISRIKHCAKSVLTAYMKHGIDTFDPYLNCTGSHLKSWLESFFIEGMSWENMGMYGWHIDHHVPVRYFDYSVKDELRVCFNYQNLRPLCAKDNLLKSGSLPLDYKEHIQKIKRSLGIV